MAEAREPVRVDVVVIGGGIQGLWVLQELQQERGGKRFSTVLIERGDLISGQTSHSHAYIHKGHMFADEKRALLVGSLAHEWEDWFRKNNTDTGGEIDSYFAYQERERAERASAVWKAVQLSIPFHIEKVASLGLLEPKLATGWDHCYRVPSICLEGRPVVTRLLESVSPYVRRAKLVDLSITRSGINVMCKRAPERDGEMFTLEAQAVVLAAGKENAGIAELSSNSWKDMAQNVSAHMLLVAGPPELLPDITGYFFGSAFVATRKKDGTHYWLVSDRLDRPTHIAGHGSSREDWAVKLITALFNIIPSACERRNDLRWLLHAAPKTEGWDEDGKIPGTLSIQRHPDGAPVWTVFPNLLTLAPAVAREVSNQIRDSILPIYPWHSTPAAWDALESPRVQSELWESVSYLTWQGLCDEFPMLHRVAASC